MLQPVSGTKCSYAACICSYVSCTCSVQQSFPGTNPPAHKPTARVSTQNRPTAAYARKFHPISDTAPALYAPLRSLKQLTLVACSTEQPFPSTHLPIYEQTGRVASVWQGMQARPTPKTPHSSS